MKFVVPIRDGSMEPKISCGDIATVQSGFLPSDGDIVLAIVTDSEAKTTQIYIRQIRIGKEDISFVPFSSQYPRIVFSAHERDNVAILGIVYEIKRSFHQEKRWLVTAQKAESNLEAISTRAINKIIYEEDNNI